MQYTINQLYDHLYEKANTIYDTFKGFFGESNVDLQHSFYEDTMKRSIEETLRIEGVNVPYSTEDNFDAAYEVSDNQLSSLESNYALRKSTIYVWWNRVTITNENNKSVSIQDLYAKIEIQLDGRIPYENWGFLLNRATYDKKQFLSNYCHSHVCDIPKNDFTQFQRPCLGTGPINGTIGTLRNEYDEVTWMLFCEELALYVTVESITGRPYHYLEKIGGGRNLLDGYKDFDFSTASPALFNAYFSKEDFIKFIKYYLQKGHLSITYRNGKYSCGMSYYEYIIDISNAFIDFYNEHLAKTKGRLHELFTAGLFKKTLVADNKFYTNENCQHVDLDNYRNKPVLEFKGREICTTIIDDENSEVTLTTVISNGLAMLILKNILRAINFRYKNEYRYSSAGSNQETSSISQRVSYL